MRSAVSLVLIAVVGAGCPAPPSEGEGSAGEGEGEGSAGEGEGAAAEGEGAAGEGEGGEGEGEGGAFVPSTGTTWQWQLTGTVDTSFDVAVYDIDLDDDTSVVDGLHADGRAVICYVSVGTFEPFRDDAAQFPADVKGNAYDPPFQDELYVDVRDPRVQAIMEARFDVAAGKGCDAIEPDNIGLFDQDTGFPITAQDNLDYARFVSAQVHARGMTVGLKNDIDQATDLVDDFDWALNEQCFEFTECDSYSANFVAAGKAVFNAEYTGDIATICATTTPLGLSTILKSIDLDAPVTFCP